MRITTLGGSSAINPLVTFAVLEQPEINPVDSRISDKIADGYRRIFMIPREVFIKQLVISIVHHSV